MNTSVVKKFSAGVADLLLCPFVLPAALLLKAVRRVSLHRLKFCRAVLLWVGVLPVRRHYYEPFLDPQDLRKPLDQDRALPGIEWNLDGQLALLQQLKYGDEFAFLNDAPRSSLDFRLDNGSFGSGDAEFLYQMIRHLKPRRILEIGSGNSTLMARRAIARNAQESPDFECKHTCIEPFEAPWLEQTGVTTIRQRVEEVDLGLFRELEANDLLFIDSSHMIRPQGDVLTEYLQILPILRAGVVVHVHDIFSPRDYLQEWIVDRLALWNEQYLLEAFLTQNASWEIIAALNLLKRRHFGALRQVCPFLTQAREPGSFYMRKLK